ncbi:MAG: biotin--[acetyl-CoA-carboxylase] ligase [Tissierellia bacterium]|nr:biotin--[acetyl-CoA-carboxylase] ligase [Tissierellia bacterium]
MTIKEKVLALLESYRGEYISGQELADKLEVSRTAIWKATNELKEEGYEIQGIRNKGYQLSGNLDRLNDGAIRKNLVQELKDINLFIYDEVDSTNTQGKRLNLEGKLNQWDVVLAEKQSLGKGRSGKSFESPKYGGIYMTILYRKDKSGLDPMINTLTTVRGAVATAIGIEEIGNVKPGIKWVNDLYLEGKKICGILTEGDLDIENGKITDIYLGIGINVHTKREEFSQEIKDIAGSIQKDIFRNDLISRILNNLYEMENWTEDRIIKEYKKRSILLGKEIIYEKNGKKIDGVAKDINEQGHLIVETNGQEECLIAGEVNIKKF